MFSGTAPVSHQVCQFFFVCPVPLLVRVTVVDKNKAVSELRSSLCERRLERTVMRLALLPVKTAQFWQAIAQASELSFQSSFTQKTAQFTQGIPQFPQFTCRQHDGIISTRHTEPTKNWQPDGKHVLCQRTFSSVFRADFFYPVKLQGLT